MRIRKLAKEVGVNEEVLLGLALELGLGRYADADQQLGKEAEERLRIAVRHRPPEMRHAVRTPNFLNRPPVRPYVPGEDPLWDGAMKGVAPLATPKAPTTTTRGTGKAPPPARVQAPPPAAPAKAPAKPQPGSAGSPPPSGKSMVAGTLQSIEAQELEKTRASLEKATAERDQLRTELSALQQRLAQMTEQNLLFAGRMAKALEEQERAERALESAGTESVLLRERVAALEQNLGALEGRPGPLSLRKVLEKRGIMGEDEGIMVLTALLQAQQGRTLLSLLSTEDPEGFREFLHEKLLLVSEGDEVPAGVVPFRVPAERSEADPPSAVRDALRRFSTACLVHNLRSIVIVGGSPAYHRVLREGLDGRLKLRLVPGDRRGRMAEYPAAEVVILWASTILDHRVSAHYPNGWIIPHRGIVRMLAAATDRIEGRSS
jgi:hypothetical protein